MRNLPRPVPPVPRRSPLPRASATVVDSFENRRRILPIFRGVKGGGRASGGRDIRKQIEFAADALRSAETHSSLGSTP